MQSKLIVAVMALGFGGVAFGPCSSKEDKPVPAAAAPPPTIIVNNVIAPPSATESAKPVATPTVKPAAKKKTPSRAGSKPIGQAVRGGAGGSRPAASSNKTSSTTAGLGDLVSPAPDPDPCDGLPDREAECDGKKLYYCQDHNLMVTDCNASAKAASYTSGDCVEAPSDHITDCLGCDVNDDGEALCCDFGNTICCDNNGSCFDPRD